MWLSKFFRKEKHSFQRPETQPSEGETPYLSEGFRYTSGTRRLHNPEYNQLAACTCGHVYHRHFFKDLSIRDQGCLFCPCLTFTPENKG